MGAFSSFTESKQRNQGGAFGSFVGGGADDSSQRVQSEIENAATRLTAVGQPPEEPRRFNPLTSVLSGLETLDRITAAPIASALTGGRETTFRGAFRELGLSENPLFNLDIGPVEIAPSPVGIADFIANSLNPLNPVNLLTFGIGGAARGAVTRGAQELAEGAARQAPRIVARATLPLSSRSLGEVAIPGSEAIVSGAQRVGQRLAETRAGEALGRAFSTTFTPSRLPASVPLRQLESVAQKEGTTTGREAFRDVAQGFKETRTRAGVKAEDIQNDVVKIFQGTTVSDRKRITAAVSRDAIDTLPERLQAPAKSFKDSLEATLKAEQDVGVPVSALERYVPFIITGRRLTREQRDLLTQRFGTGIESVADPKDDLFEALAKADPSIRERTTRSFSPDEVNEVLGKEWLEEDAAELLAKRRIRAARAIDLKMFLDGVAAKYGLRPEDAAKFLERTGGSAADWRLVRPRVTSSGAVEFAEVTKEEMSLLQRSATAKETTSAAFGPVRSFDTLSKQAEELTKTATKMQSAANFAQRDFDKAQKALQEARDAATAAPDNERAIQALAKAERDVENARVRVTNRTRAASQAVKKAREARAAARAAERESRQATQLAGKRSEQFLRAAQKRIDKGDPILLPAEIVDNLNEYTRSFFNDRATREIVRLFDDAQNIWKGLATVIRPGFHVRNGASNVWQAWLAGLRDPRWYAEAANVQRNREQFADLWEEVRNLGVVGTEFVTADVGQSAVRDILNSSLTRSVNPFSEQFALTRYGRRAGRAIEDNARLALYLFRRSLGETPEQAAVVVKKYLFDYFDLTPFERNWMKRVLPFYTWMRKNIPLQLAEAVRQPGKFAQLGRIERGIGGEQPPRSEVPGFLERQNAILLPGEEGERVFVSLGLPAADLNEIPLSAEGLRDLLGSASPLLTTLPQIATNQQFFSGAPIEQFQGEQDPIPVLNAVAQLLGRGEITAPARLSFLLNQVPIFRNIESAVDPSNERRAQRALSILAGGSLFGQEDAARIASFEERDRLRGLLRSLQDRGVEVPTVNELGGGRRGGAFGRFVR